VSSPATDKESEAKMMAQAPAIDAPAAPEASATGVLAFHSASTPDYLPVTQLRSLQFSA